MLSENIQGVLVTNIESRHFNQEGVFRFSSDKNYKTYSRLTFEDNVGMNSFYINELEKVKDAIGEDRIGNALTCYLYLDKWETLRNSNERVDLFKDESIPEIQRILRRIPTVTAR